MTSARRVLLVLGLGLLAFSLFHCATSSDIVANPVASGKQYRSAYLVVHGDRSSDVDASVQRELFRRRLAVTSGPEGRQPETADLIVKYADAWNWDMTMYLQSLDIQVYDAKVGTLLGSASWKNSPMHGFHGLDNVVAELVSGLFKKLGIGSAAT